jgi:CelD/BcsL family acetyltransferase involved in cellulose biosynthesis
MKWTFFPVAQFEQLASIWNALNDSAGSLPFLHSRFIAPLCQTFGDRNLTLALCGSAHEPLAMGILTRKAPAQWETFQPSQLPLGAWVMRPDQDFEHLLSGLSKNLPGVALVIGVTQQDPSCIARPTESAQLQTLDYVQTARVPIGGSFDDYWSMRGKNLRNNMKRQRTKLAQDGVATRLEILTGVEEVGPAIEDYGHLESGGWKAAGGTAISPHNAQGRFYRSMLEAFCRIGVGRIYRYRFAERVVAVDLCIEGGGALVILKTTYDESIKTFSPAFLMREEAFRALFGEKKVKRVEFFGKVMEWHARWTDDVRTLYHVNWHRWPTVRKIWLTLKGGSKDSTSPPLHRPQKN